MCKGRTAQHVQEDARGKKLYTIRMTPHSRLLVWSLYSVPLACRKKRRGKKKKWRYQPNLFFLDIKSYKNKTFPLPAYLIFSDHVIGNTHIILFGIIIIAHNIMGKYTYLDLLD